MVKAKPAYIKILVRLTTGVAIKVMPAEKKFLIRLALKLYLKVFCHMAGLATMITNNLMS